MSRLIGTKYSLCKGVGGRHAETGSRGSVCLGRSRHRFTRPGVIPTSTPPHGQARHKGIGQAGSDKVDTAEADEVIDAIAKTVAELTSQQDGVIRRQVIEHLMRQIMHHDAEFRREEATSAVSSHAKH